MFQIKTMKIGTKNTWDPYLKQKTENISHVMDMQENIIFMYKRQKKKKEYCWRHISDLTSFLFFFFGF